MSHLKKNIHSFNAINDTNLKNIKTVLDDIKTNTDALDVNTDDLETKLTDGTQITQVKGNTQADGTGDSHFLHVDNSGNLIISNTQNLGVKLEDLSSTLNADHANHSRTVAVGLRGRTDIADETSGEFLLCNSSGRLQVDVVTGAGGDASEATLSAAEVHLGNIETSTNKITQGYDATISSGGSGAQQILCYGRDSSGNLDALNVDNNGHLKIAVDTVENKGSFGNIQNGTLNFGTTSSTVNVSDFNHSVLMYEDTNTSTLDDPIFEISPDNTNFYKSATSLFTTIRGSKREGVLELKLHGITHVRIKNESTADNFTNAKATIVGTPN